MSSPPPRYDFLAAVAYAKKIWLYEWKVAYGGAHRGKMAKLDEGYFIIERFWRTPKPSQKPSPSGSS